jgi:hypothetical protein
MIKKGKYPANARVDVDYTNGKPKVNFSYPSKVPMKQAIKEHSFGYHTLILVLILWMIPYLFFGVTSETWNYKDYPTNCNVSLNDGYANVTLIIDGFEDGINTSYSNTNYRQWIKGADFICDNGNYSVYFKKYYSFFSKDTGYKGKSDFNYFNLILFLLLFLLILPVLIYFLNKKATKILINSKRYCHWFPKSQAKGILFKTNVKKYRKFNSKDVLDNIIIIPRFNNVELDYKTKGDFSKYLEKVKIREYQTQKINIKTNKKSKIEKDNYKWYAVFYFKQKPKTGYLEVFYQ